MPLGYLGWLPQGLLRSASASASACSASARLGLVLGCLEVGHLHRLALSAEPVVCTDSCAASVSTSMKHPWLGVACLHPICSALRVPSHTDMAPCQQKDCWQLCAYAFVSMQETLLNTSCLSKCHCNNPFWLLIVAGPLNAFCRGL